MTKLRALTIAGFDPSGGAGVLADSSTFSAMGCEAAAVITSITYQTSNAVFGATHQSAGMVRDQLMPLLNNAFACAKTGMLPTCEVVEEAARLFRETNLPAPVVDPVMISSSGHRLMEEEAVDVLIQQLLPLARLVTPNISEAERITSIEIRSEADMLAAATALRKMGARAVLIKGGHLRSQSSSSGLSESCNEAIDVLDNEGVVTVFREKRIKGVELHGTGCRLSAAIAAGLGTGLTLEDAVDQAKRFVWEQIRAARKLQS
jgi:hydroxymethylpyrimidine/phosphomethylpyrimidine kinase